MYFDFAHYFGEDLEMKSRLNKCRRAKYRRVRDVESREQRHTANQAIREGRYEDQMPPARPLKWWNIRPNRTVLSEGET